MPVPLFAKSFTNDNITEQSVLVDAVEEGAQAIKVADTAGFEAQQTVYVGQTGADGCERAVVASIVDGTNLNLSAPLERAHNRSDAVTAVLGDRLRIRRAVNVKGNVPVIDAFSPLASRAIQADRPDTYYTDSTGGAGYWYLLTYWNELTDEETPLTLSAAVRGDEYARYATLSAIRAEAGFSNATNLSDVDVDQQRRAAETEINATLANYYATPFKPVPDAVRVLTEKLAAAFLKYNAYGSKYQKLVDEARASVQLYADQGASLTDTDGNSLSTSEGVTYDFGDQPRMFGIGQQF